MKSILLIFLFFIFVQLNPCNCQSDGTFWWLTTSSKVTTESIVVTEAPTTLSPRLGTTVQPKVNLLKICCECVPFYLCPNGTIVTDGIGLIDVRLGFDDVPTNDPPPAINVEVCPILGEICCAPPDVDPSCSKLPIGRTDPLPPDTPCECVVHDTCNSDLVINNGFGSTSIHLSDGRLVSHSQCIHSLDVCCANAIVSNNSSACECVEKHLCDVEGFIITDGVGSINIRLGPSSSVEPCTPDGSLVCCHHRPDEIITKPDPNSSTSAPVIVEPVYDCDCVEPFLCDNEGYVVEDGSGRLNVRISIPEPVFSKQSPCPYDSSLICCRLRNKTYPETTIKPCGFRNKLGIGTRILGFKEGQTQFGEFPWVVTLLRRRIINGEFYPLFLGGASLIHPRVVMTAAHKVRGLRPDELQVRLGEWDASTEKETLPHQDVLIDQVIVHPNYQPGPLFHDVALLILKEEAKLNFHINTICIAENLHEIDEKSCVANGWGVDSFNVGDYQVIMKGVKLPLVPKFICQSLLRKTRLSKYFKLHRSFLCAGGELGADSCKGDGGGPLSCRLKNDPTRYAQVGITAWGIGCGEKDSPGVYVDVPLHIHWIKDTIKHYFP